MTDAEWLTCTDPKPMLEYLRNQASQRKLLLFAFACYRRIWHLLLDERSRMAVEVVQRYAEGRATEEELNLAPASANAAAAAAADAVCEADATYSEDRSTAAAYAAAEAACSAADAISFVFEDAPRIANAASYAACAVGCQAEAAAYAASDDDRMAKEAGEAARVAESIAQANILRDLFGNPFRPVSIRPSWLAWNDATVVKLAEGIHGDHAFDRLPVLADALEEAGCYDAAILGHCRHPGPHVRGCWVVDLLTGRN